MKRKTGLNRILITGESGVGKTVLAKDINETRNGKLAPFVEVNCSLDKDATAFTGWKKGSFTDATYDHPGHFSQANGGSLFLDEIQELSDECQAAILKTLDDGKVTQKGGSEAKIVEFLLISATNKDLKKSNFRPELLSRINHIEYHIECDIRESISAFVPIFLNQHRVKFPDSPLQNISEEAIDCLMEFDYPENIRSLKTISYLAFEQAKFLGATSLLREHIYFAVANSSHAKMKNILESAELPKLLVNLHDYNKKQLDKLFYSERIPFLVQQGKSQREIARILNISRNKLASLLKKHDPEKYI